MFQGRYCVLVRLPKTDKRNPELAPELFLASLDFGIQIVNESCESIGRVDFTLAHTSTDVGSLLAALTP